MGAIRFSLTGFVRISVLRDILRIMDAAFLLTQRIPLDPEDAQQDSSGTNSENASLIVE